MCEKDVHLPTSLALLRSRSGSVRMISAEGDISQCFHYTVSLTFNILVVMCMSVGVYMKCKKNTIKNTILQIGKLLKEMEMTWLSFSFSAQILHRLLWLKRSHSRTTMYQHLSGVHFLKSIFMTAL